MLHAPGNAGVPHPESRPASRNGILYRGWRVALGLLFALWALIGFGGFAWAAADAAPLRLGIMPFNSTLALIKTHQPLVSYLEANLGRKVVVNTAPDYVTFLNELLDGRYDLTIAGPHFAVMAQEKGEILLYRYKADLQPVFVVRAHSTINTLEGLKGKSIGLSSPLSISSIGGMKWLHDNGFTLGQDYRVVVRSTHGASIASVAIGELDAALTTYTPLKQIPEDVRAQIRILPLDIHVPHLMTLANPRLGPTEIERIRTVLGRFPDSPEGKKFFAETGYMGYTQVSSDDLRAMKPFIALTQQLMRQH